MCVKERSIAHDVCVGREDYYYYYSYLMAGDEGLIMSVLEKADEAEEEFNAI